MARFNFEDIALTLETLPDEPTPAQIRCLKRESLDRIDFQRKKWICQAKGCCNGTAVRDYGTAPWYFLDRNSKASQTSPVKYWCNLERRFLLCGKHNKIFNRLKKSGFTEDHIARRILDWNKPKLLSLNSGNGRQSV